MRHVHVIGLTLLLAGGLNACTSSKPAADSAPAPAKAPLLPASAPELEPLAFMTGQWVTVNANRSVNREHWMRPSGKTFLGMFQQQAAAERGGGPVLYELSAIVAEKDGITLYLRHLHRKLELDDRRKDVDVFRIATLETGKAVFVPINDVPGGIQSVTYRSDGPNTLVQDIAFKPDSKEKGFSQIYSRE